MGCGFIRSITRRKRKLWCGVQKQQWSHTFLYERRARPQSCCPIKQWTVVLIGPCSWALTQPLSSSPKLNSRYSRARSKIQGPPLSHGLAQPLPHRRRQGPRRRRFVGRHRLRRRLTLLLQVQAPIPQAPRNQISKLPFASTEALQDPEAPLLRRLRPKVVVDGGRGRRGLLGFPSTEENRQNLFFWSKRHQSSCRSPKCAANDTDHSYDAVLLVPGDARVAWHREFC